MEDGGGTVTDTAGRSQSYDQPICGALISNGGSPPELIYLVGRRSPTQEGADAGSLRVSRS